MPAMNERCCFTAAVEESRSDTQEGQKVDASLNFVELLLIQAF